MDDMYMTEAVWALALMKESAILHIIAITASVMSEKPKTFLKKTRPIAQPKIEMRMLND